MISAEECARTLTFDRTEELVEALNNGYVYDTTYYSVNTSEWTPIEVKMAIELLTSLGYDAVEYQPDIGRRTNFNDLFYRKGFAIHFSLGRYHLRAAVERLGGEAIRRQNSYQTVTNTMCTTNFTDSIVFNAGQDAEELSKIGDYKLHLAEFRTESSAREVMRRLWVKGFAANYVGISGPPRKVTHAIVYYRPRPEDLNTI